MYIKISMKYVMKHGNQFLYQRAVPNDLRAYFGKKTIKQSLNTNRKVLAAKRAQELASVHSKLFRDLRNEGDNGLLEISINNY